MVASLAVASFATLLQDRIATNAAGGPVTPEAQALSFGDVYGYALLVLVAAALMTLSLRRPSSASGVRQSAPEVVSSAV